MALQASKNLQRFDNPNPERDYEIFFDCPEFTCLCPLTGQPDFAHIEIRYYPGPYCVELKSLKQYMWSYRNEGAFHEKVTNTILEDLVAITGAEKMEIKADFLIRGGIRTIITAKYFKGQSSLIPLKENVSMREE